MKTSELFAASAIEYYTLEAAKTALKPVLDFAGVKEEEPSDYIYFIHLKKNIIYRAGMSLYAIWITNHYNDDGKKVFVIKPQTEHAFSLTIKPFIQAAVNEGSAILSTDFKKIVILT